VHAAIVSKSQIVPEFRPILAIRHRQIEYLTELLRHAAELKQHPSEWMPWNYRDTLARLATPAAA
jgi:hypothetical protein